MAIQQINLGTYANSGTGDDLRTAFEKVNANILELASTIYGANVGANPPISGVEEGELWWSTVEGRMYIKYGTAWIDASPLDGNTTYNLTSGSTTGGVNLQLTGTDLSQDSIKFASSTNVTVTRTDVNTITFSSESFTGNVTGNLLGNVQGNVAGNVTGNTTGIHTGAVIGNVTGDVLGDTDGLHTGAVIGDVTGDVTGDTTGTHTGAVIGNVTGNVTGDVTGNTSGTHTGVVIGDVNGDIYDGAVKVFDNQTRATKIDIITDTGNIILAHNSVNLYNSSGTLLISGNSSEFIGSLTGNASTVTNGVYTNNSYADPTWITSLAGSKVSGNISGNAGSVTNGVYTTGDQTIGGNKTFSSNISGNISGNAGSVTNGVYTNNSYADPTWITSLAGSKVSGNISGNAGTVTNGVYTSSSINALSDVDTVAVAPSNGQTLVWNSGTSQWNPGTIAPGGVTKIIAGTNISINPTNGLGDVTITSTATGGAGGSLDFGTFSAPAGFSLDLGTF